MRSRFCTASVLFITLFSTTIPALAHVNTKRSVSFGDSLTDNDLLFLLFPNDPAVYGADPFEAAFNKAAIGNDELTNYAILGSTSANVLEQVKAYGEMRRQRLVKSSTFASVQAGGNDMIDNLLAFASAPPGANAEVDFLALRIKVNIIESVVRLLWRDRRADVVVWTVPDITQIPAVLAAGLPAPALANVRAHIESINDCIRALNWSRRVAVLDAYAIMRDAVANPPTFFGMTLVGPPAFGSFDNIFADPIHPTAVSNAILANGIITAVNKKFHDNIPQYNNAELGALTFPLLAP